MPESILTQIERRLIASRVPLAKRQRALQELSDHREDLIQAGLADGLTEIEATIRADKSLGGPVELAEQIVLATRQSSWWGRNPFLAFGVLPFFGTIFAIAAAYWIVLRLTSLPGPLFQYNVYIHSFVMSDNWAARVLICHIAQVAAVAALAITFCELAQSSTSKRHWMWIACGICSVQSCLWTVFVGHTFAPPPYLWPFPTGPIPLESAIIPVAIAVARELRQSLLARVATPTNRP